MNKELLASVPPAPADCTADEGPALEPAGEVANVDGTPLHDPDEVTEAFRNKAELWRQLNPGPGPFPGRFIVLASSRVETSALLPWLAAVQRAGFSSFGVYMRAPLVPIATKTRGILYKQRCCVRPITLAETAQPLSRFKTWGELARATQGTALSVSLH